MASNRKPMEADYRLRFMGTDNRGGMVEMAPKKKRPRKERLPGPCRLLWETREGKKVRVCSMKDSHLLNSILYVERHADLLQAARIVQVEQKAMRSYDAADREAAALRKKSPEEFLVNYPPYRKLYMEARRRRLVLIPVTSWCEKAYNTPLPAV